LNKQFRKHRATRPPRHRQSLGQSRVCVSCRVGTLYVDSTDPFSNKVLKCSPWRVDPSYRVVIISKLKTPHGSSRVTTTDNLYAAVAYVHMYPAVKHTYSLREPFSRDHGRRATQTRRARTCAPHPPHPPTFPHVASAPPKITTALSVPEWSPIAVRTASALLPPSSTCPCMSQQSTSMFLWAVLWPMRFGQIACVGLLCPNKADCMRWVALRFRRMA
jgi:hypothetical protein